MELENADILFEKPLHEEVNCPWVIEDHFGYSYPCIECENNEQIQMDIEDNANWLVLSGVVGVRNQNEQIDLENAWVEAMNIVIRERKDFEK